MVPPQLLVQLLVQQPVVEQLVLRTILLQLQAVLMVAAVQGKALLWLMVAPQRLV
jgi:hypothetical protein